jgi:hypothetical protein
MTSDLSAAESSQISEGKTIAYEQAAEHPLPDRNHFR